VKFAESDAERALFEALDTAEAAIKPALAGRGFRRRHDRIWLALRAPIDAFFNAVQVNAENEIIRRNRLNLLYRIVDHLRVGGRSVEAGGLIRH
jgi:glycyl-tRNA synthetase beta chain